MIVIALGANLPSTAGPPENTLRMALDAFTAGGVEIDARSALYRSQAWPDPSAAPFVNAVVRVSTGLSPLDLLKFLHEVEESFGRRRSANAVQKNAPRTLDLDLIDYDGLVQTGPPTLPHPRMMQRAFVLLPLREVAPDWSHPETGRSVSDLIADLGAMGNVLEAL